MVLLAIVIIGVSVFCFSKGYIFIGIWTLLGGFSRSIGFTTLIVTSIYLFIKGHFIVGLFPILIIIWNLGWLYREMHRDQGVSLRNFINALLKRKPGIAYGDKEKYDKEIECYQKAVEINPEDAKAYYNMGIAYSDKGNYDKAIECYQNAIEIDPLYARAYYNMGRTYFDKGNYDKEIECYQKAVEINPDFAMAYNNMGIAYGDKENYDKEIECYQKAVEINPEDAKAYYNMGIAYVNKGMDISSADSFYKSGLLYLEQNKREDALEILDLMKKWTPDSHLIQKLIDKLYEE